MHALRPVELDAVPAGQRKHWDKVVVLLKDPALQREHVILAVLLQATAVYAPTGHSEGHSEHTVDPALTENWPWGQAVHAVLALTLEK